MIMKNSNSIQKKLKWELSSVIITVFLFSALNCPAQVTTERIVSNSEELIKRDFTLVNVVKFEPQNASLLNGKADSSGVALFNQLSTAKSPQAEFGFVKSDFIRVFPEAINTDEAGVQNIDYYKLIPIMFRIIQNQEVRLKTLENQVIQLQKSR
jgi:hypothetical protein